MDCLDYLWNKFILKFKKVRYGTDLQITGRLFVHGRKGGIQIGDAVTIHSNENINPTSGIDRSHLRTEGEGIISIGNHVGMSHVNITAFNRIVLEDHVLIGSGVKIWDTDFHSLVYTDRMRGISAKAIPITIKKGAFIGACSIILKGVTIGEYAVVGAGSVVTKDIPSNEVWAGNPIQFIRKLKPENE